MLSGHRPVAQAKCQGQLYNVVAGYGGPTYRSGFHSISERVRLACEHRDAGLEEFTRIAFALIFSHYNLTS
jgi:hypothetical protein